MTQVSGLTCYLNTVLTLDNPYLGFTAVYVEAHRSDYNYGCQFGDIIDGKFIGSNKYCFFQGFFPTEEIIISLPILNIKPVINRVRTVNYRGKHSGWKDGNVRFRPTKKKENNAK